MAITIKNVIAYPITSNNQCLVQDTPLENLHKKKLLTSGTMNGSENFTKETLSTVNLSDAIRLALLFKTGGWYSDLDIVFLRPINHLKNVAASDDYNPKMSKDQDLGAKISNAIFNVEKNHPFIQKSLKYFTLLFDGSWGSGGPTVLFSALVDICGLNGRTKIMKKNLVNPEACQGFEVLPPRSFYPIPWVDAFHLGDLQDQEFWDNTFKDSYVVHFYGSSAGGKKIMKRQFYGNRFPAYLTLAEKHCPISFDSVRMF